MLRGYLFLIAIFATLFAPFGRASAEPGDLSLSQAVRSAWQSSPQLSAQNELTALAAGDRWRRWLPNEPQLSYGIADDHSETTYGVQLNVPLPGKSIALSQQDRARYRAQVAESGARRYDIARQVVQTYVDCAAAQAGVELQKQTSRDLETIFKSLRALYESGHSTQAEKIGAELQARQAQVDLVTAEDRQEVSCRKFVALLRTQGEDVGEGELPHLRLPDDLDESLVDEVGDKTSDQNRALGAVDLAASNAAVAGWTQLPDLTLSAARNHYNYLPASPNLDAWTTSYGIAVNFPLFFLFEEHAEARRQRHQAELDRSSAETARAQADSDQLDGLREYRRSKRRLNELRSKDLALAEALMESTSSAYRAGKLGFAELILSRKTLNDLRTQDISLRAAIIGAHLRCLKSCSGGPT